MHWSDYIQYDATGLAALVAKGDVTPGELLDCALDAMARLNPDLNAVVLPQPDTARAMIDAGLPGGPFNGVPFLMKDLGAEAVDFPTNNGSRLMQGHRWGYDSEIYLRMQATGVVPFARTTSPEFGIGPVTEASVYGGPTRNPWDLSRTSGGSSGGSGAAVAAGIVPMAHGSDGGGSVRIPAASCGLVGLKPSRARLPDGPESGEGWGGMAIDGFLTRSLRDTAVMLDACAGPDLGAPYHAPPMDCSHLDAMQRDTGQLRVKVATTTLEGKPIHPDCAAAAEATAKLLEDMGHIVEPYQPAGQDVDAMMEAWTRIVACGTAATLRAVLKGRDLIPGMVDAVTFGAYELAQTVSGADYIDDISEIHAFGRRAARLFLDCDVLLSPTLGMPPALCGQYAPTDTDFRHYRLGPGMLYDYSPYTAAFNASGQPCVSLPTYWNAKGLPIGVHLAMAMGDDVRLMALSARLEEATDWRLQQITLLRSGGILQNG